MLSMLAVVVWRLENTIDTHLRRTNIPLRLTNTFVFCPNVADTFVLCDNTSCEKAAMTSRAAQEAVV